MSNFDQALAYTIQNEGTEYTNDPEDSGGATKFGITIADLSSYRGKPSTPDDVKNMTYDEAKAIYKTLYWDVMKLDSIYKPQICTALFDIGVNQGQGTAIKMAQQVSGATPDCVLGPQSVARICSMDTNQFLYGFISKVQKHYIDIVVNKPDQIIFLHDWIGRSQRLITLIG